MVLTAFGFLGVAGGEASPPRACPRHLFVPALLDAGWLSVRWCLSVRWRSSVRFVPRGGLPRRCWCGHVDSHALCGG